jgi:hypothetical protein
MVGVYSKTDCLPRQQHPQRAKRKFVSNLRTIRKIEIKEQSIT